MGWVYSIIIFILLYALVCRWEDQAAADKHKRNDR